MADDVSFFETHSTEQLVAGVSGEAGRYLARTCEKARLSAVVLRGMVLISRRGKRCREAYRDSVTALYHLEPDTVSRWRLEAAIHDLPRYSFAGTEFDTAHNAVWTMAFDVLLAEGGRRLREKHALEKVIRQYREFVEDPYSEGRRLYVRCYQEAEQYADNIYGSVSIAPCHTMEILTPPLPEGLPCPSGLLSLRGEGQYLLLLGEERPPLYGGFYRVVEALARLYPYGLSGSKNLDLVAKVTKSSSVISDLKERRPEFAPVIRTPGTRGGIRSRHLTYRLDWPEGWPTACNLPPLPKPPKNLSEK